MCTLDFQNMYNLQYPFVNGRVRHDILQYLLLNMKDKKRFILMHMNQQNDPAPDQPSHHETQHFNYTIIIPMPQMHGPDNSALALFQIIHVPLELIITYT